MVSVVALMVVPVPPMIHISVYSLAAPALCPRVGLISVAAGRTDLGGGGAAQRYVTFFVVAMVSEAMVARGVPIPSSHQITVDSMENPTKVTRRPSKVTESVVSASSEGERCP
eukprot:GHVR01071225.1.p1 GENE.GHVR01071225.1~~GHVR01071225.1.p1  ORF type:complete len:113 (+),score=20.57 GHVR01071225.1:281-619(+)